MMFRGIFILAVSIAALNGCSLYQSDGRKALEKNAFGIAGVSAQSNLLGCHSEELNGEWLKVSQTEEAAVFASEHEDFALKVVPLNTKEAFNCGYRFASAQEMIERTDSAIEITIHELGLSLGTFAFPASTPLK